MALNYCIYFGVTIHTSLSSAGVGQTGTFIAIDSIQEQVKNEKIIDIAGVVNKMRQQRMKMVQTEVCQNSVR